MLFREETCVRRLARKKDWLQRTRYITVVVVVVIGVPAIIQIPLKPFHLGFELFDLDLVILTFPVRLRQQVDV